MKVLIRTMGEFDLEELSQHLLVVGDLTGDCFNCKEIGLDYSNIKICPKCKTEFRYISSRSTTSSALKILSTLHKRRPDLTYVEFGDLKQHKSLEKARNFLS